MAKIPIKQKSTLIVLGIIAALILLEIGLRAAGLLILTIQDQKNRIALDQQDSYRILCLGESTTFIGGELSYPAQLEYILNASTKNREFKVINKGVPGVGSTMIVDDVEQWLEQYTPDIVIVMMGINDHNAMIPVDQRSLQGHPLAFLKNLRIFKLARWLKISFQQKSINKKQPPPRSQALNSNQDDEHTNTGEMDLIFADLKEAPAGYRDLYKYAVIQHGLKNYHEAEQVFTRLLKANRSALLNRWMNRKLADCLREQNKYSPLALVVKKMLQNNPYEPWTTQWVWQICKAPAGHQTMKTLLQGMIKEAPTNIPLYDLLEACHAESSTALKTEPLSKEIGNLRNQYYNPVTQRSYQQLLKILSKKNVQIVFVQYPLRSIESLKRMVHHEEGYNSVVFVDNENIFRTALASGRYEEYFTDRFAGNFGHCTPKGNHLLAKSISDTLRQTFFKD